MFTKALFSGVNAAVVTALRQDLSVDIDKTAQHCRWLLQNGSNGLAVLGTTGEANSLGHAERMSLLEGLVEHGIAASALLPGTGTPNIPDTVALTRHAGELGCRGVLILPPFYYKSPSEDGIYAFYSEVVERVGGEIKIYLYSFPQQSAVPITLSLVERLLKAYPGKIKGIKDSVGDIADTTDYIKNFGADGFEVYTGADAQFQEALKRGAAGCITATSNLTSPIAARIHAAPEGVDADRAQALLAKARAVIGLAQTIPAVKVIAAHLSGDAAWANVRPPFCVLSPEEKSALEIAWDACRAGVSIAY
jgi:4-hydroxy-tetrahydrodipicolinate synthase